MSDVKQVICFGEILVDLLSNEADKPWNEVNSWTPYTGGAPANVAFALRRLGMPSAFTGCIGNDETGRVLLDQMKQAGINTEYVQLAETAPTRKIYVERNAMGERFFAGFGNIPSEHFADTLFSSRALEKDFFAESSCLLLGTLLLSYPAAHAAILKAIELSEASKILLAIDVNWRPVFWADPEKASGFILPILRKMDLVKFSKEEALLFFGTDIPLELSKQLPKASIILVSDGEKGCKYVIDGFDGDEPALNVKVVDTTGAGDCFLAGFLFSLLKYKGQVSRSDARSFVRFANAAGALSTTKAGALSAQPDQQTIQSFLSQYADPK